MFAAGTAGLGSLLSASAGLGLLPPSLHADPSPCFCQGTGGRTDPTKTPPSPSPLPPVSQAEAMCRGKDNLANEVVKGPLVTCPGLPSAHLGNSIERLESLLGRRRLSLQEARSRWRWAPYIKIITRRNRWPARGAQAHLGRAARPGEGRSGPPPREPRRSERSLPGSRVVPGYRGLMPGGRLGRRSAGPPAPRRRGAGRPGSGSGCQGRTTNSQPVGSDFGANPYTGPCARATRERGLGRARTLRVRGCVHACGSTGTCVCICAF